MVVRSKSNTGISKRMVMDVVCIWTSDRHRRPGLGTVQMISRDQGELSFQQPLSNFPKSLSHVPFTYKMRKT